ncbi:hypothetical protein A2U01_0088526 [Trifolium medium]|uniref:Uncharacterized protein n=1 Tax=Trifolium medium TaxID=97028 RepID=A0A392U2F8_9FABA|nr:hypothetical protein [Trifolium medium]
MCGGGVGGRIFPSHFFSIDLCCTAVELAAEPFLLTSSPSICAVRRWRMVVESFLLTSSPSICVVRRWRMVVVF